VLLMANTIFPDLVSAGGVIYRDAAGVPLAPPNVQNAYSPLPPFVIAPCDASALPSDCDARIEPRQVNAIVSELLSFAECMDPTGTWNCDSLQNLCAAFSAWVALHATGVMIADEPPVDADDNRLWWESDTGFLFVKYNDGNSTQWVQITSKVVVDNVSIVGAGLPGSPFKVGVVDCGVY